VNRRRDLGGSFAPLAAAVAVAVAVLPQ
jgi:hypothetical protein